MDSVLRPRDIQARIRSGEDPEAVAAAAQTTVEKIMGFAAPVMAERAYIAEQALKASVRRRAGDGPIGQLGEAVEERLATRDVAVEDVTWDAWRRDDGRWALVADIPGSAGTSRASFVYDVAGRYVTADDDEARWLVGERGGQDSPGEQLPLGDDAIELVTGARPASQPTDSDDWMQTQASERTAQSAAPQPEPEALFEAPEPAPAPSPEEPAVVESEQAEDTPPAEDAPAKPRKSSKSRRASVPSWDEIMFGSGKGE